MNPVRLALRALRVDPRTRYSALLTATGVAVATALVLFLAALPHATQARLDRAGWQRTAGTSATDFVVATEDDVDDRQIVRLDVSGHPTPPPGGPQRLPAPGQVLLSPQLADLVRDRPDDQLADRFPGSVVGVLEPGSLKYPEQLVAVVGHAPGTLQRSADSGGSPAVGSSDQMLDLLAGVGIVLLSVPSLVLVASASRLTAARRERRLAALRLAGATPAQVVWAVAAETAVAAVSGTLAGLLLSWPLRYLGTNVPWGGGTWLPSDFAPPVGTVLTTAVGVPLLVVGAAVLALRRVVRTPVGAAMQHTRKKPTAWRLLALAVVALFFAFGLAQAEKSGGTEVLLAGLAAIVLAASVVGPWVTGALGRLFTRLWRRPALLLAGRRLCSDPKAAYRSVSGVVLAVFAGTLALTLLPSFESMTGGGRSYVDSAMYVDVEAAQADSAKQRIADELARVGVPAPVVRIDDVRLSTPDGADVPAMAISCRDAAAVTRLAVGSCAGPPGVLVDPGEDVPTSGLAVQSSFGREAKATPLPPGVPVRRLPPQPAGVRDRVLIDPALVPRVDGDATTTLVVAPSGADREQVRTALVRAVPGSEVRSREIMLHEQRTTLSDLRRITAIGLSLATLLAGCSAAITAASSVIDRRRTFSALIAAGTPLPVLGRALRTEAALPALVATLGAGAGGIAVGLGLLTLFDGAPQVFTPWLLTPVVVGVVVSVLAASSSGPMLRRVSAEPVSDE
ncbi:FtsX-like permease family protein [Saccharopolyspora rosea]|uniref:FtsX-like permease family protein n=1 Tax=Saccharopolyspora rosea TaxID=524884 RepID=A0ABW3FLN9_9PSEU|nr:FtsX-like permease family protein [Saccharopolyspora rosea]